MVGKVGTLIVAGAEDVATRDSDEFASFVVRLEQQSRDTDLVRVRTGPIQNLARVCKMGHVGV